MTWLLHVKYNKPTTNISYFYDQGREGNDNPLEHSCLETPIDGRAW